MASRIYEILLHGQIIGWLSENDDGRIGFRFISSYRENPQRPVLSQSFEDDLNRTYWGKRPGELPSFFWNLLPEGHLRTILEKSLGIAPEDDLTLLAAVSRDLPGALSLRDRDGDTPEMDVPPDPPRNDDPSNKDSFGLRFSLSGVQLKFSMLREGDRFTLPAHDQRGDWIVKLGSEHWPGLVENEYAMLNWARLSGFSVPDAVIHEIEEIDALKPWIQPGTKTLAVRRYDRIKAQGNQRLHQEDFAQVTGKAPIHDQKYDYTYERLAVLVQALLGEEGVEEFVRRLAFVIASGNADAHLKNWSLIYLDDITPSLTPLYDQVSTVAWSRLERKTALKLASIRDFGRIDIDTFMRFANKARLDSSRVCLTVKDTLAEMKEAWKRHHPYDSMLSSHAEAIREHWRRVPLLRSHGELES